MSRYVDLMEYACRSMTIRIYIVVRVKMVSLVTLKYKFLICYTNNEKLINLT